MIFWPTRAKEDLVLINRQRHIFCGSGENRNDVWEMWKREVKREQWKGDSGKGDGEKETVKRRQPKEVTDGGKSCKQQKLIRDDAVDTEVQNKRMLNMRLARSP